MAVTAARPSSDRGGRERATCNVSRPEGRRTCSPRWGRGQMSDRLLELEGRVVKYLEEIAEQRDSFDRVSGKLTENGFSLAWKRDGTPTRPISREALNERTSRSSTTCKTCWVRSRTKHFGLVPSRTHDSSRDQQTTRGRGGALPRSSGSMFRVRTDPNRPAAGDDSPCTGISSTR